MAGGELSRDWAFRPSLAEAGNVLSAPGGLELRDAGGGLLAVVLLPFTRAGGARIETPDGAWAVAENGRAWKLRIEGAPAASFERQGARRRARLTLGDTGMSLAVRARGVVRTSWTVGPADADPWATLAPARGDDALLLEWATSPAGRGTRALDLALPLCAWYAAALRASGSSGWTGDGGDGGGDGGGGGD